MLRGMGTSRAASAITPENRGQLGRIVGSGKTERRHALRARIVLGAADDKSNSAPAEELKTSRPTVIDWRQRYAEGGTLYDDRPRGRSFKPLARAKEAEISPRRKALPRKPRRGAAAAWPKSAASARRRCERVWHANGLKPHLLTTFKLSNDPGFIEKLEDVVGLYMNPPAHAVVICIDEKSRI